MHPLAEQSSRIYMVIIMNYQPDVNFCPLSLPLLLLLLLVMKRNGDGFYLLLLSAVVSTVSTGFSAVFE
jgi:hypothetical protein